MNMNKTQIDYFNRIAEAVKNIWKNPAFTKDEKNTYSGYKYTSTESVLKVIQAELKAQNLYPFMHETTDGEFVTTIYSLKESTEQLELLQSVAMLPEINKEFLPENAMSFQHIGARLTYMKKYQLCLLLGLKDQSEVDPDAHDSRPSPKKVTPPTAPAPAPSTDQTPKPSSVERESGASQPAPDSTASGRSDKESQAYAALVDFSIKQHGKEKGPERAARVYENIKYISHPDRGNWNVVKMLKQCVKFHDLGESSLDKYIKAYSKKEG